MIYENVQISPAFELPRLTLALKTSIVNFVLEDANLAKLTKL